MAKGCCWQEMPTSDPSYPWCFFPGGSSSCMLGQIAKDNDEAIKSAAQAYHMSGSQDTVDAYRKACMAHGDRFFSFFVTPQLWIQAQDNTTQSYWHSTAVTLIKYGCNAAACDDDDIDNVMNKMEVGQQQVEFKDGFHSSFRYNVTSCAFEMMPDQTGPTLTKCTDIAPAPAPEPGTPAPTNAPIVPDVNCPDNSSGVAWWLVVVLVSGLVVLAGAVGFLYNKYKTMSPELHPGGYRNHNSFGQAADDLSKPSAALPVTASAAESPRSSLVSSQF